MKAMKWYSKKKKKNNRESNHGLKYSTHLPIGLVDFPCETEGESKISTSQKESTA
eukprot:m.64726 g.64726  ORF g.64726 m.64726 type:complete len:55 (+) comp8123_c0_seq3:629-793(+)